ncbi:MFS transporter, partial [Nocardioides sp. CER28]
MTTTTATPPSLLTTRTSVALSFALNGLLFATLVSRYPDVRSDLDLSNSALGLLLISGSIGSVLSLPLSGRIIERFKPAATVRGGSLAVGSGLMLTGVGATVVQQAWLAVVGLFVYGIGTSIWDVAMNVEGAEVERRLGRTIMPRFHAAWSVGSIAGSGVGVLMAALGVPVVLHYLLIGVVAVVLAIRTAGTFLPVEERHVEERPRASVWREPRTLVIGLMVLCYATVEGTANDWLSLAVIDGYHQPHWVGIAGFSVFVVSMTAGRLAGPLLLDRF